MPRITSKGQITIPQEIRNKFALQPGTDAKVIIRGNNILIVKSKQENKFLEWLGRGKRQDKLNIDLMVDQLRGRTDE